jgi:Fe-S oxidoreductase
MSGALPKEALTGDRIYEALDLCVECKACKAECPTGVDMAKLKYEVLAQRHETYGVPLRARVFAQINLISRLTSPFGRIANLVARIPPLRLVLQRVAGIAAQRPLPAFASQSFQRWFKTRDDLRTAHPEALEGPEQREGLTSPSPRKERGQGVRLPFSGAWGRAPSSTSERGPGGGASRGDAVLFHDTFTDYYHPEVGKAAVRILEALGYNVVLAERAGCCGRPAISKGLLSTARRWARTNVDALLPYARRGVPIVGTEPSCLLTFRDEYPDLLRDDDSKAVAAQSFLLDELLVKLAAEEPNNVAAIFREGVAQDVLLHAHCHQKAIVGPEPTLQALRLVPGYKVSLVETSCCGMAGSFGFEAEHYEVSKAMGSLKLFPAVEAASPATAIAITGVSCRQQIGHFTSRKPRHALEILADALK